jgi:hypothetical protein
MRAQTVYACTDYKSGRTDYAMASVGPINQNMAWALGDWLGLGWVACSFDVLVIQKYAL